MYILIKSDNLISPVWIWWTGCKLWCVTKQCTISTEPLLATTLNTNINFAALAKFILCGKYTPVWSALPFQYLSFWLGINCVMIKNSVDFPANRNIYHPNSFSKWKINLNFWHFWTYAKKKLLDTLMTLLRGKVFIFLVLSTEVFVKSQI